MARKHPSSNPGTLVKLQHRSSVLADNPLGDPAERILEVYLPPGYEAGRRKRYPVLFDLVGYTGSGPAHTHWKNFEENVPERLDRLIGEGAMPPCIVAFPDCFTALGGNQYINSTAIGAYADYLVDELVPLVDAEFRTYGDARHRGCFGKSSGGYGALVHGMQYAHCWGAVASHSGDCFFEFVYQSEWPAALTELQRYARPALKPGRRTRPAAQAKPGMDDGRIRRFLEHVWDNPRPGGNEIMTLMMVCMAATYDTDPKAPLGFRIPYDLNTGEFIEAHWAAWRAHDPLHLVTDHAKALRGLRALYIDCGWRDQYHIHFGTRRLSDALRKLKVPHRYEEFDATHSGVDYRMDVSLPYLARALS